MSTVFVKKFDEPKFNIKEILRYSQTNDEDIIPLINECIDEVKDKLSYRVCYAFFDVEKNDDFINLTFTKAKSKNLIENLKDASKIVLFGATIGIEIDRLIAKYGKISPLKALIFQSIGAERIESLCDMFCDDISKELNKNNLFTLPRFSPGYGDFYLTHQNDIFNVLNLHKNIGLTLNSSYIMSPSKSVTAIMGITDKKCDFDTHKCKNCNKKDCSFKNNDYQENQQ